MADRYFADMHLASLYDLFCEGRADFDFYLELVMTAGSVLDVGCGTGALLHRAREAGHTGHLCGLDPAPGMLAQARRRSDIEWVLGDLSTAHWRRKFDLVVMTGHAFQVFLEDDELRAALSAIRAGLVKTGRFVFETRNPLLRAWEHWPSAYPAEITGPDGARVRLSRDVQTPVVGDRVSFTHHFNSPDWDAPQIGHSTLRFIDVQALGGILCEAGLGIEAQFGDWDRSPFTAASPEIITIARSI